MKISLAVVAALMSASVALSGQAANVSLTVNDRAAVAGSMKPAEIQRILMGIYVRLLW